MIGGSNIAFCSFVFLYRIFFKGKADLGVKETPIVHFCTLSLVLAIFTLKFKFLGTIALNLGLLQLKALKFAFNFFQVKALKALNPSTFFKSRP